MWRLLPPQSLVIFSKSFYSLHTAPTSSCSNKLPKRRYVSCWRSLKLITKFVFFSSSFWGGSRMRIFIDPSLDAALSPWCVWSVTDWLSPLCTSSSPSSLLSFSPIPVSPWSPPPPPVIHLWFNSACPDASLYRRSTSSSSSVWSIICLLLIILYPLPSPLSPRSFTFICT